MVHRSLQCSFISLILAFSTVSAAVQSLSSISYSAAGVLPLFTKNNKLYAVLSREAYGRNKGTYDSFAGSRDAHEHNPTVTAARECAEEMISHRTMNLSVKQMQQYIDPRKKHTTMVLAYPSFKYVLFITHFDAHINAFLRNFYPVLRKTRQFKYREKDRIAIVAWDDLQHTILHNKNQVCAEVLDPYTNKATSCMITVRPIVLRCLRPFFRNNRYQSGQYKKIRFY
jgi:hypothetical protein